MQTDLVYLSINGSKHDWWIYLVVVGRGSTEIKPAFARTKTEAKRNMSRLRKIIRGTSVFDLWGKAPNDWIDFLSREYESRYPRAAAIPA